jgi:purine-nucleoside phosphorylase
VTGALEATASVIRRQVGEEPFALAVVLGSGLGALADQAAEAVVFPYADLPALPPAGVAGHAGRLVAGWLGGCRVLFFQGRHHIYEGYDARQAAAPVRLAHELGCRRLLLTNAAGGVNGDYRAGDFMLIADHLNLLGDNPLRGERDHPFVDLSSLYAQGMFAALDAFARQRGIRLHRGVLAALPGPSYETPAEIRALRLLGADAVSMSTIPEAIMGKYLGMEVAGLSFIANVAAGLSDVPLSHDEVLAAGRQGEKDFGMLVRQLIARWFAGPTPPH